MRSLISVLSGLLRKAWNTPTGTIWASNLTRTVSLAITMPLAMATLSAPEIAVWLLFATLVALLDTAQFGFTPSFVRAISYALGGAQTLGIRVDHESEANWPLVSRIVDTMHFVYLRLTAGTMVVFIIAGTAALLRPIAQIEDPAVGDSAWVAWAIVVVGAAANFYANHFRAYLQGVHRIVVLYRWFTVVNLISGAAMLAALLSDGGLLGLVAAQHGGMLLLALGLGYFSRRHQRAHDLARGHTRSDGLDREIFDFVWPATWRSGLGVLFGYAVIQLSGVFYAQIATSSASASYLLALQLMRIIQLFANAPFYGRLPEFNSLYAQSQTAALVNLAKRGMRLSFSVLVVGIVGAGLCAQPVLMFVGSEVNFPAAVVWPLLGLSEFLNRYGAMHLQLYSVTNHILWHIANGIQGMIFIAAALLLFPSFDAAGLAVAMLVSNIGFYSWYPALQSYRAFDLRFRTFEWNTSALPLLTLTVYILFALDR